MRAPIKDLLHFSLLGTIAILDLYFVGLKPRPLRHIMIRRNALALSSGCVIDPETLFVLSRGLWSSANERSRIKVPGAQ